MPYLTVYRIEDPTTRIGPYQRGGLLNSRKSEAHRPAPVEDGIDYGHIGGTGVNRRLFAFRSAACLRAWFDRDDEWTRMDAAGFRIALYEVDSSYCAFGRKQLTFLECATRRVRHIPLSHVLLRHYAGESRMPVPWPRYRLP